MIRLSVLLLCLIFCGIPAFAKIDLYQGLVQPEEVPRTEDGILPEAFLEGLVRRVPGRFLPAGDIAQEIVGLLEAPPVAS